MLSKVEHSLWLLQLAERYGLDKNTHRDWKCYGCMHDRFAEGFSFGVRTMACEI
jgi:hypothetical protein